MLRRLIAALLLITAVPPHAAFSHPRIATWNKDMDKGGDPAVFEVWVAEANQNGQLAVIQGNCWSACALKLSVREVCIYPSAEIHFHGVHYKGTTSVLPEDNELFIAGFPPAIKQWVTEHHAMDSVVHHVVLTGQAAIQLGVPDCTVVIR